MKIFIGIVITICIVVPIMIIAWFFQHPCIEESQPHLVHHNAWLQMIPVGKIMVPVNHPAYDNYETECLKRK